MTSTSRVGLGSPAIDFSPRWAGQHRRDISLRPEERAPIPTQVDYTTSLSSSSSPGKTGSVLDRGSGLPSPPGTNSDIALPTPMQEIPHAPSLMNESPPANLVPRDPLSRSSSFRARPLAHRTPSMASSTSGSAHSENRIRALRPVSRSGSPASSSKAGGSAHGISRSISSSSVHSPLRPKFNGITSASPGSPASRHASVDLSRRSLSSSHSSRHSVTLASDLRSSSSATSSRRQHSPSAPSIHSPPVKSASPVKRRSGIYSPSADSSSARESPAAERQKGRRVSSGSELDGQIKEAEEKIRQAARRRTAASRGAERYPSASPTKEPMLHHHETYTRAQASKLERPREDHSNGISRSFSKTSLADFPVEEMPESDMAGTEPPASDTYRQETYRRAGAPSFAQQVHSGHETLRRSATVSSAASMRQTPAAVDLDTGEDEQERSGGSGGSRHRKPLPTSFRTGHNSLFTPSPKAPQDSTHTPNHAHLTSPTAPLSRFSTTSRLAREQSVPSPSSPSRFRPSIDGLERSSSVSSRVDRRQWSESVSGLPRRYANEPDNRGSSGLAQPDVRDRQRAATLADEPFANSRYSRDRDFVPRLSRLSLAPGDSVSAVGDRAERLTPTSNKDPLDVLRRIEAQRNEHNRQWDADRAASVLGDRPGSGSRLDMSPKRETRMRPATSMSSLREQYHVPRTAPIDRIRRDFDHESPLQRSASRLSHIGGPATEPRPMRSSTSLGGRSSTSLDVHSASSEHGRLMYEATRALETKIPPEVFHALPDISRPFTSAARSAEANNAAIRAAMHMASQLGVEAEMDSDPERILHGFRALLSLLREANRMSDQNVRDLTRVLLDVPKLLREAGHQAGRPRGSSMSTSGSVMGFGHGSSVNGGYPNGGYGAHERDRSHGSPYSSPVRRSEDLLRPSTAAGDMYTPDRRRNRESLPANFAAGEGRSGSNLMSRMRNFGRSRDNLATIQDSPPKAFVDPEETARPPISPARRMLRKKASSTSTHTVRAGSNFMPSSMRVPTTAISTVTADPGSPVTGEFDTMSIRSVRSRRDSQDFETFAASSPSRSKISFHTAQEPSLAGSADAGRAASGGNGDSGADGEDELLSGLVEAQRRREELDGGQGGQRQGQKPLGRSASLASKGSDASSSRKWSVSDRFKATLKRG